MKKFFGVLIVSMTTVAIVWANYRAVSESVPFFKRMFNKVRTVKVKETVQDVSDRVVHIFKSRKVS